jgi:hypothetical protein
MTIRDTAKRVASKDFLLLTIQYHGSVATIGGRDIVATLA